MKIERNILRNYSAESRLFIRRVLVSFFCILFLISLLIANLYHLQVTNFEDYSARSNKNRIKLLPVAPSRGIIYDRNGVPLAVNRTVFYLEIIPEKISNLTEVIAELRHIVNLSDKDIINFKRECKRSGRFVSLPIKVSLNDVQQARFAVNQYRFPCIKLKSYQRRYYPYRSVFTHAIGYVSKINDQEIEQLKTRGQALNYLTTDNIGKLGIERYYEIILHGKPGYKAVEVNNRGEVVRQLYEQPPQAGKNITLSLDLKLQQYIVKLLANSRAAVVVMDPRDGGIRALVSNPSYDPNLFVNGISNKKYHELLEDKNRPFINRATQGVYPPASTVKPYILLSALTLGVIDKNMSLFDPGWWQLPGSEKRYRDWKRWGHGWLNVTRALEESADTFFYQIAYDMGIDRLSEWMMKFGYGRRTGIDLYEEQKGLMPTRKWKMTHFKTPWYQGDTIPVGIGQGYWTATPLQMSKSLMILINSGAIFTPHLLYRIKENEDHVPYIESEKVKQIGDSNSEYWEIVRDGMYGVANRPNGTARKNFIDSFYKVAAKSGTAQVYNLDKDKLYNARKVAEHLRDHKLMTAFAPYNKPKVVVVVVLENGGIGMTVGNITRKILDYMFLNDSLDK